MKLSTLPWVKKIGRDIFHFLGESPEEKRELRDEQTRKHQHDLNLADELERLDKSVGFGYWKSQMELRIEGLRRELEKPAANAKMIQARLDECRKSMQIVADGVEKGDVARKALLELEKHG